MTPVNEGQIAQFSYHAQPMCIFTLLTDQHCPAPSVAQIPPQDDLTCATVALDRVYGDAAPERQTTTFLLGRETALLRPRIRPARPVGHAPDRQGQTRRARMTADGTATDRAPVRPTHPTHLVIVSARRTRPARPSVWLPVEQANTAARTALCAAAPAMAAPDHGQRTVAHVVALIGIFMSLAETAAAQQVLSLF